jgi:hypothetical protein
MVGEETGSQPASTASTGKYSDRCGLDAGTCKTFAGQRAFARSILIKKCPNPQINPNGAMRVGLQYLLELLLHMLALTHVID